MERPFYTWDLETIDPGRPPISACCPERNDLAPDEKRFHPAGFFFSLRLVADYLHQQDEGVAAGDLGSEKS